MVEAQCETNVEDLQAVQKSNHDAHSAMLASFLELRITYLRVCVDMQENPRSVSASMDQLKAKLDDGITWLYLLERSRLLKDQIHELEAKLQDMNWAQRNLSSFIGGVGTSAERELAKLTAAYTSTLESEREIMEGFHSLVESAKRTREALDSPAQDDSTAPTLVYWKD
jgi:hypothetical protein